MKLSALFIRRRWLLWAPLMPNIFLYLNQQLDFLSMLVGSVLIGTPYWLAWWLSDGFSGIKTRNTDASYLPPLGGVNPVTGASCIIYRTPSGPIYVDAA